MLQLTVKKKEFFDNKTQEFLYLKEDKTITMEHSLVSISKWESKYHKPFISDENKTPRELQYYAKCMTITQNVDPLVYMALSDEDYKKIVEYIEDKHSATFFSDDGKQDSKGPNPYAKKQIVTSELIYYWMVALEIPFDPCQKWHLNNLLILIKICQRKNEASQKKSGDKKTSRAALAQKYAAINARRRKK